MEQKVFISILVAIFSIITSNCFASSISPDINADLNGDRLVTNADISKLSSCFAQDPKKNSECRAADVDQDGDIDRYDFSFVSDRLGQAFPEKLFVLPGYWIYHDLKVVDDLNGDGTLDLVFEDEESQEILVHFGNGDGSFQAQRYDAGSYYESVLHCDSNGDGIPDLVAPGGDSISNQNGSFQTPQRDGVCPGPGRVLTGDLDSDGILDRVVTNYSSRSISVRLGNEDGSFQAQQNYNISLMPTLALLNDTNGDDVLDLIVTNSFSDIFLILLGNGDGSFQAQQSFFAGSSNKHAIVYRDLNSDDVLDLLIANRLNENISILFGNEDGSFQEEQQYDVGRAPETVRVSDLNGDNVLDLVVGNATSEDISVLLGSGDGSFQPQQRYEVGFYFSLVTLADTNGDGALDMVASSHQHISILLGKGDGSFAMKQRLDLGRESTAVIAVDDIDNDGILDLALQNGRLLFGNGDGSFETVRNIPSFGEITLHTLDDLNGDGVLDLVVATVETRSVSVFLGNDDGSFQSGQSNYLGSGLIPVSVDIGDINGDGILDMAVGIEELKNQDAGVSILLGNGDGSFQAPQRIVAGEWIFKIKLADLNSDGALDLVFASGGYGYVSVMLGNGDGSFQAVQRVFTGSWWWDVSILLGELNGDGVSDLILTNGVVLLGNGDGSFEPGQHLDVSGVVALEDINGDSAMDIVLSNGNLLLGNGDGSFQPGRPIGSSGDSVGVGDVNGDGVADLVFSGQGVSVMLGNGDGTYLEEYRIGNNNPTRSVVLGDINGNGRLDIVVTLENSYADDEVWIIPDRGNYR
jgi:hypothetical protein